MPNTAVTPTNTLVDAPFKPAAWLAKIDFINHLVLFNNVLMAVLAEQGAGKTTFIHLLCEKLDPGIKSCVIEASAPFDQQALIAQLCETFHLRYDGYTTLTNVVEQINERKAHVLVIIDDAEQVPDAFLIEVLRELKKQGSGGFFHFCLVSDYSLAATLNQLDKDTFKNLIHTIEPGALNENETRTYLLSSLTTPNHLHNVMSAKRLRQFYALTNGNIARINQEMVKFFSGKGEEKRSKRPLLARASMVATVTFMGLSAAYLWQNQEQIKTMLMPLMAERSLTKEHVVKDMPSRIAKLPVRPLISQIPEFYVAATHQVLQPPPLKKMFDLSADEDNINNNLVVMDKVLVIPKHLSRPEQRETAPARKPLASSLVAVNKQPTARHKPLEQHASKQRPATPVYGRFTIQLLASRSHEEMKRFMNSHALKQAKLMRSTRSGVEWYVLIVGEYQELALAKAAMSKLPDNLMHYKPWVRSISGLKG